MTTVENLSDIKVEESLDEFGKPTLLICTPKFKADFIVKKSNDGFSFFQIVTNKGRVPKELSGFYTTLYNAKDSVLSYINKSKESATVRRDKTYEENH